MDKVLIRILLSPFSLIYGIVIGLRNFVYNVEIVKSISFNIPVISVGNLTMGGAGKTPHIDYLITLLKPFVNVATLSRGYGRKTKGFFFVRKNDKAELVGDEPLQFAEKHNDISVAIAENRVIGINNIIMHVPSTEVVLLDDAYQHRSVKPTVNILLTEYNNLFTKDYLLPAGRLREWRSAYKRADIIIISKCPDQVSIDEKTSIINEIKPFKGQQVFYSKYSYLTPYYIFNKIYTRDIDKTDSVLLVCALARTDYLLSYLEDAVDEVKYIEYEDHHYYTETDLRRIASIYDKLKGKTKYILTTEKDAARLKSHEKLIKALNVPILVLPAEVSFLEGDQSKFNAYIKDHLLEFKT